MNAIIIIYIFADANYSWGSHKYLVDELLSNYGPVFSRPVKDFSQTVVVHFYMLPNQIVELVSIESFYECISLYVKFQK